MNIFLFRRKRKVRSLLHADLFHALRRTLRLWLFQKNASPFPVLLRTTETTKGRLACAKLLFFHIELKVILQLKFQGLAFCLQAILELFQHEAASLRALYALSF